MDILEDHAERVRHADKIRLDAMLVSAALGRSPLPIRDGVKCEFLGRAGRSSFLYGQVGSEDACDTARVGPGDVVGRM